jgi:transposase
MKCKDIAKELNLSINTVTGSVRYAREYMNQLLTKKLVS